MVIVDITPMLIVSYHIETIETIISRMIREEIAPQVLLEWHDYLERLGFASRLTNMGSHCRVIHCHRYYLI